MGDEEKESCDVCGSDIEEGEDPTQCKECGNICCDMCIVMEDIGDYCLDCEDVLEDLREKKKKGKKKEKKK